MSKDRKKWLGLGKDSECRCMEFHTDLNQLCDTCPLKKIIPEGIQYQIVNEAEDNRELMPPEQFTKWIEGEIKAAAKVMQDIRRDSMTPELHYPNVLTEHFIWNKERAKALRAVLDKTPTLEEQAAQIIKEAEDKAARFFEDWKNRKRHTLAEGNPDVLAQTRRRYIEHHERTFIPYLDFEGQTHAQLISRLKFILGEVKAGRDSRPAEHYSNRLAHRMKNAQIIEYLAGLTEGQEGRKAEPEAEPLPTFPELFFNEANADKVRGLMPPNGKYVKSICFAMATELHRKGYCPKYSKEVIARVLAAEFYDLEYPEYFREKRYTETDQFEDFRKRFYKGL